MVSLVTSQIRNHPKRPANAIGLELTAKSPSRPLKTWRANALLQKRSAYFLPLVPERKSSAPTLATSIASIQTRRFYLVCKAKATATATNAKQPTTSRAVNVDIANQMEFAAAGGCIITNRSPANFACRCQYTFYTCYGYVELCQDESSPKCKNPDDGPLSCKRGRWRLQWLSENSLNSIKVLVFIFFCAPSQNLLLCTANSKSTQIFWCKHFGNHYKNIHWQSSLHFLVYDTHYLHNSKYKNKKYKTFSALLLYHISID